MKRWKVAVIALTVLSFTGCIKRYDITEDKSNAVAEYMAGALLQSDRGYKENLITEEDLGIDTPDGNNEVTPTTTPIPTTKPTNSPTAPVNNGEGTNHGDGDQGTEVQKYTLSQVIGVKEFEVNYLSKKTVDTYKENIDDIENTVSSGVGEEVLVVSFKIKNLTNKEEKFNLMQYNIDYLLTVEGGATYEPCFTVFENDMKYCDISVPANNSKTGILLFKIPKDKSLTNPILTVSSKDKKVAIQLK